MKYELLYRKLDKEKDGEKGEHSFVGKGNDQG